MDKITVSKLLTDMPFLKDLVKQTGWKNNSRVRVEIHIDSPINLSAPFHDGCCRYTSFGKLENGKLDVKSHYAGCYDTCLCNPAEVLGTGMEGKIVKDNCFYAVADSMEYWRIRTVHVWMRSMDMKQLGVIA